MLITDCTATNGWLCCILYMDGIIQYFVHIFLFLLNVEFHSEVQQLLQYFVLLHEVLHSTRPLVAGVLHQPQEAAGVEVEVVQAGTVFIQYLYSSEAILLILLLHSLTTTAARQSLLTSNKNKHQLIVLVTVILVNNFFNDSSWLLRASLLRASPPPVWGWWLLAPGGGRRCWLLDERLAAPA